MNQQNKVLEIARKCGDSWNKKRAAAENKGIEKFYKLKELFKKQKPQTITA